MNLCNFMDSTRIDLRMKAIDVNPDQTSDMIMQHLDKLGFLDMEMNTGFGMALTEALINAVDYGCLGLDSNDKAPELSTTDLYSRKKTMHMKNPGLSDREINIRISIHPQHISVRIQDPGPGVPEHIKPRRGVTPNGKGILMMKQLCDQVIIRRRPSCITLIKNRDDYEAKTSKGNKDLLNSLADTLSCGILAITPQKGIILWNSAASRITAIKKEEVLGKETRDLPQIIEKLLDPEISSIHLDTDDDEIRYIEKEIHPINKGDGRVSIFSDITDTIHAREEMDQILMETSETKDLMEEQAATLVMTLAEVDEKNDIIENQNKKMVHELEMAGKLQKGLLPDIYESKGGISVASKYIPSMNIGGDIYDMVDLGQGLTGFIIADVSGHGVAAALVASMFKMSVHSLATTVASPKVLFHLLNDDIKAILTEDYITSFYLIVDKNEQSITYSNAGHPYPLFYRRATSEIIELDTDGFFLGMFDDGAYGEGKQTIEEGDALLLYTDCIIETENSQAEQFGKSRLTQTFTEAIKDHHGQEVIDMIEAKGRSFCRDDRFDDDFTMLLLEFTGLTPAIQEGQKDIPSMPDKGSFEEF
ncbi:MAG: SpoIIE family protein phosphatase [Thermodesulfobacteriota bacterium]|nr:SpoIIE family protein phosphatase [Thermodesulfobacteriota bacterium]